MTATRPHDIAITHPVDGPRPCDRERPRLLIDGEPTVLTFADRAEGWRIVDGLSADTIDALARSTKRAS